MLVERKEGIVGPLSNASCHALISKHGRPNSDALSGGGKRSCWTSHCMARFRGRRRDGADQEVVVR